MIGPGWAYSPDRVLANMVSLKSLWVFGMQPCP